MTAARHRSAGRASESAPEGITPAGDGEGPKNLRRFDTGGSNVLLHSIDWRCGSVVERLGKRVAPRARAAIAVQVHPKRGGRGCSGCADSFTGPHSHVTESHAHVRM